MPADSVPREALLPSHSVLTCWRDNELWSVSLTKRLVSSWGLQSHDSPKLNYLPKSSPPSLLISITLRVRASTYEF